MTALDGALAGICALSVAWGAWRGLVREVLSLFGWLIAFLAASLLAGPLADAVPTVVPTPELRLAVAYVAVFVLALFLAAALALLVSTLVRKAGLGGVDRTLGALFGVARAAVLAVALGLLAGLTSAPRQPWWRDSVSGPFLAAAALAARPYLPPSLAGSLRYD